MLEIKMDLLKEIHALGEKAYPEEGVGFLFGTEADPRRVTAIFPVKNTREEEARHNRYQVAPRDYLKAEDTASKLGLSLIGVFHSHPDHPNIPSEFDKKWADPFFSYIINHINSLK